MISRFAKYVVVSAIMLGVLSACQQGQSLNNFDQNERSQAQIKQQALTTTILVDFESGLPGGWFVFSGAGASVAADTLIVADNDALARPGQLGDNTVLESNFNVGSGFAGFGQDFNATTSPQDWSDAAGVSFWFYGTNSANAYQFEIFDNRSDPAVDTSERFDVVFIDDFVGWQQLVIPFTDFTRAIDFQPGGAPNDGLTLTEIYGWAVVLDGNVGTLHIDELALELPLIDDFESGLFSGSDSSGNAIGFVTFNDPNSTVAISTTSTPPEQPLGAGSDNNVLQVDTNVNNNFGFAGLVHLFENQALNSWTPQDWSSFAGIGFWLYGNNTGSTMFIDILDNLAPGSSGDTAERFSVDIIDDFAGWRFFEIPFADFNRKEIGNGAPNDGFNLNEVYGWAFGVFDSGLAFSNYLDNVGLFGEATAPELAVTFSANNYDVSEGGSATISVKLNRPLGADANDPQQVGVSYLTEPGTAIPDRDYSPAQGTLSFNQGGPSEQTFSIDSFEDNKHDGDSRAILRLVDPLGVTLGFVTQATLTILDDDPLDTKLIDDFERGAYLWDGSGNVLLEPLEVAPGDPLAVPAQGAYENILQVSADNNVAIRIDGNLCNRGNAVVPVAILTTDNFDATTVDHSSVRFGVAAETHVNKQNNQPKRHEEDVDNDGDTDLLFHFRVNETGYDCNSTETSLTGATFAGETFVASSVLSFGRDFAIGQNWAEADGLSFWFYGTNSGLDITVQLKDNRAPDPGPSGWSLVWSDEFNEPVGTPPNPANWSYEIGDGAANGIPGWGNSELQYYSDSTENAAMDGSGNLLISAKEADGSLQCYYGPCDYSSARLISWRKAEFAYGRIEARIKLPQGAGLWPAFWSLGTDIDEVGWPQTGEIDIMEFVGRLPNEIFGTIHGPGYSGGQSFGNTYNFAKPAFEDFHTFAIEWEPDSINWYVDGILYHSATPGDVAPNEWVFNDPVFLLLNVAVGGNFGGPVAADTVFPQELVIDYVRVYQGPDSAERFEASFSDNFSGWQKISLPFSDFSRSAKQPAGAPNDGLGLDEVWGYGFKLSSELSGNLYIDQLGLEP